MDQRNTYAKERESKKELFTFYMEQLGIDFPEFHSIVWHIIVHPTHEMNKSVLQISLISTLEKELIEITPDH